MQPLPRSAAAVLLVSLAVACGSTDATTGSGAPAADRSTTTAAASTTAPPTPAAGAPTTGPMPPGGADRDLPAPTIASFKVTPEDAPCRDGKVQATMSWQVSPATATVWVTDDGIWLGDEPRSDLALGPLATEGTGVPVPDWVKCDGRSYALGLTARIEGAARFSSRTGVTVTGTP